MNIKNLPSANFYGKIKEENEVKEESPLWLN